MLGEIPSFIFNLLCWDTNETKDYTYYSGWEYLTISQFFQQDAFLHQSSDVLFTLYCSGCKNEFEIKILQKSTET